MSIEKSLFCHLLEKDFFNIIALNFCVFLLYLKFDEQKYDKENHLLAYVYMKNKTFINAHLIKYGFAVIDTEYQFSYIDKFSKLLKVSRAILFPMRGNVIPHLILDYSVNKRNASIKVKGFQI